MHDALASCIRCQAFRAKQGRMEVEGSGATCATAYAPLRRTAVRPPTDPHSRVGARGVAPPHASRYPGPVVRSHRARHPPCHSERSEESNPSRQTPRAKQNRKVLPSRPLGRPSSRASRGGSTPIIGGPRRTGGGVVGEGTRLCNVVVAVRRWWRGVVAGRRSASGGGARLCARREGGGGECRGGSSGLPQPP